MCGLSGILSQNETGSNAIISSLQAIKHRGPDDTRILVDGRLFSCSFSSDLSIQKLPSFDESFRSDCYLGFNRLSIVDLSEKGMQPFYDQKRRVAFMMNGEVYNYTELRTQFLEGVSFDSETDSEVAFRLYLKLGDDFIHHLRGMFAIVIYDYQTETIKVWRDRLGIKPFYYAITDDSFIFSSEMKGIFSTGLIKKEIDYRGLAYSMYLTTCPAPLTIYKNISSLQAGHRLEFHKGSSAPIVTCYWHLQYQPSQKRVSYEEMDDEVTKLCSLYRTKEVERAIMLSGGVDSGLLAYYLGKVDKGMKCINIFAEDHSTDEREYARINAENAALPLYLLEIPTTPTLDDIEEYLTSEEEPNSSAEAALFLSKGAHSMGIKVLYNALGPDEIFGGYDYFRTVAKFHWLDRWIKFLPEQMIPRKYRTKLNEVKQFGLQAYPFFCRALFSWQEIEEFLVIQNYPLPQHPVAYIQDQVKLIYPSFDQLPLLKQVSYLEVFYYISSHHAFRSDQPSMKYSIEMRFPFLDHLFVQKYFNQVNIFDGLTKESKYYFREFARRVLPAKIFEMPKKGFSMPTLIDSHNRGTEVKMKEWYWKMFNKIIEK